MRLKVDRNGGEQKRDRTRRESAEGEWRRHGEDDEHKGKRNQIVTNFHSKQPLFFVAYNFRFIEMKGGKLRRCVASQRLFFLVG